jgi:Putative F0F1-ATPase subunit Ca2+/Mg2+ transporter
MPADENEAESGSEEQRRARFRVLDLSAVGLAFPIALLLGYFGGRLIGGWLGNPQAGAMIGVAVGIAGGFYNLFKMVSRLAPKTVAASSNPVPAPPAGPAGSDEPESLDPEAEDFDDDSDDR